MLSRRRKVLHPVNRSVFTCAVATSQVGHAASAARNSTTILTWSEPAGHAQQVELILDPEQHRRN